MMRFLAALAFSASLAHGVTQSVTFTTVLQDTKDAKTGELTQKKVWVPGPGSVKAKAGDTLDITLKNQHSAPHGFSVPGLVDPVVVEPGKDRKISVKVTKKGTYPVKCHLHPPHVGSSITVE